MIEVMRGDQSSRLLVEVDDVAVWVTQPHRSASPRLGCRRLENLNTPGQQTLVACVHVSDLELRRRPLDISSAQVWRLSRRVAADRFRDAGSRRCRIPIPSM